MSIVMSGEKCKNTFQLKIKVTEGFEDTLFIYSRPSSFWTMYINLLRLSLIYQHNIVPTELSCKIFLHHFTLVI